MQHAARFAGVEDRDDARVIDRRRLIAAICFLVGAIFGWVRAGDRLVLVLIAAGLFFWVLTTLLR